MLFLKDTNGDDKADVQQGAQHRLGHRRHARRPVEPALRARQLHLGHGRLLRLRRRDERQADEVPRRASSASSRTARSSSSSPARPTTPGASASRETFDVFGSTANNDPSFYVAIPNRYFEGVHELSAGRADRSSGPGYQSAAQFYTAHFLTPYIRQVDVRGGYTAAAGHQLYTARVVPEGVLEPDRVHHRADRAPRRPGHHGAAGRRLRHPRRLEPDRRRRGVVLAGARAGRSRRRGLGRRLVQLHQPAQPDAARLQQRARQRLRDVDARQVARPHLPRRLPRRAGGEGAGRCPRRIRPAWWRR